MHHGQSELSPEIPGEARLSASLGANDDDPAHGRRLSRKQPSRKIGFQLAVPWAGWLNARRMQWEFE
jgi:hypothetical protein